VGQTAYVSIVIAHGAGSSGTAAARLLGATAWGDSGEDLVLIEDRTGDVERVIRAIDAAVAQGAECTHLIGVSLGAHAVARWASGSAPGRLPRLTCVLPAWTGAPGPAAAATASASAEIADQGIESVTRRLTSQAEHPDIVRLLRTAWSDYSDAGLADCLATASTGRAPTPDELARIGAPIDLVGWHADAFHPVDVIHEWMRHLPRARAAIAAGPTIGLLQRALATLGVPTAADRAGSPPRAGAS
jgi:hypothetical protein